MGRTPCCDKASVKRGSWSAEEDAKLKAYIERHGTGGNWIALPRKIGLRRCGKSCRLRWLNYLRPNLKRGKFSEEEDDIICRLYFAIGSRWSVIAAQLPGRTDNDIKNHWNTRLKKDLLGDHQLQQQQQQKARLRDVKTAEIKGDPAADDVTPLGGQPPPSYGGGSPSLISPASAAGAAAAAGNSHGEASESSTDGGFPTELDEIFRFESVKLETGMSVDWNEATDPLVCSDLVDQESQGILLQQQFTELAHHLEHFE